MTPKLVEQYTVLAAGSPITSATGMKARFLSLGQKMAAKLAADLKLSKGKFSIKVNHGRDSASGVVILRSDSLFVELGQVSPVPIFAFAGCIGRTGPKILARRWLRWSDLAFNYPTVIKSLSAVIKEGEWAAQSLKSAPKTVKLAA